MDIDAIYGTSALAKHLKGMGIEATVVPSDSDERLQRGLLRTDLGYVKLEGFDADIIAVRVGGGLGLHPSNWSTALSLPGLRIPVIAKQVSPAQYHFAVLGRGLIEAHTFKADLKRPGAWWSARAEQGRWVGGRLAGLLEADRGLHRLLAAALGPHEAAWVRADPPSSCVRVVFKTRLVFRYAIIPQPRLELDRGLPSREVVEAMGRIAWHAKALL